MFKVDYGAGKISLHLITKNRTSPEAIHSLIFYCIPLLDQNYGGIISNDLDGIYDN